MMWPYTVRLNPLGAMLACLFCLGLYLLYSASSPAALRHFEDSQIGPKHVDELSQLFMETINLKKLLIAGIKAAEAGGREVVATRLSADLHEKSKGLTKEGAKEMVTQGDLKSHWVMVQSLAASFTGLQIISEEKPSEDEVLNNLNSNQVTIKPFHERDFVSYSRDIKSLPHDVMVPLSDITVWIDPLDATQEYTEHDADLLKYITTMVCVAVNGAPTIGIIHAPFQNKTYWAWVDRGTSETVRALLQSSGRGGDSPPVKSVIVSRSHSGDVSKYLKDHFGSNIEVVAAGGAGYKILQVLAGAADAYVHRTIIKKWDICAPNALVEAVGGRMTDLEAHRITYSYLESAKNEKGVLATATLSQHRQLIAKLRS